MVVSASETTLTDQAANFLEYLQSESPGLLQRNDIYEYVQFVNNFNSGVLNQYFLHMTDFFAKTGTEPDEEKYKEVLLNILQTYDLHDAGAISEQKKMDNLKTFEDYGHDIVKIGAQSVSVMSNVLPANSELEEGIALAVDGLSVLSDTTENWIDALSDLETIVQNYSAYAEFLTVIQNNAEKENLKTAAASLKKNLDDTMRLKLQTYGEISIENLDQWSSEFFSDIFFESCKLTEEYENDVSFQWFIDSTQNILKKMEGLSGAWDLGKMVGISVGNFVVGGENLINRLLETMAIKEIGETLASQLQNMATGEFQEVIGTEQEFSFLQRYVALSQLLIGCRTRGEYCWYSILSNDAGLLSAFNTDTGQNAESVYISFLGVMEDIEKDLEKILETDTSILEEMPSSFMFSSGVGAWWTELTLAPDGSFTGRYYDSDMGSTGPGYANGTVSICNFSGNFSEPVQIGTYTYSMQLENLQMENSPGEEAYEDEIRYLYSTPYGLEDATEVLIYAPGMPMSELPEGFTSWIRMLAIETGDTLPFFGIYNVAGEKAFVANE